MALIPNKVRNPRTAQISRTVSKAFLPANSAPPAVQKGV
jgi:hypothetical protein